MHILNYLTDFIIYLYSIQRQLLIQFCNSDNQMSGQPTDIQQIPSEPVQNVEMIEQKKQDADYFPPTEQPYQYKIFINEYNSYIGSQLIELFRNDDQIEVNPNIIISTLNQACKYSGELDKDICKTISIKNKALLNSVLATCDIIVYHLNENNLQDFEHIVKFMKQYSKIKNDAPRKKLICISSIKTWTTTRTDDGPILNNNILVRNNVNSYQVQLQNICLSINNNAQTNTDAYVIYSGIVYGFGQYQLFTKFKRALQQQQNLLVYGKGSNYIPMIHLQDLCQLTKLLAFKGCVKDKNQNQNGLKYYFGVDKSKITQEELVRLISETLGNGRMQSIPVEDAWLKRDFDTFLVDVQVEEGLIPCLEEWHCRNGFKEQIGKIVSQFNTYRGLKPNKVVIVGAPAAGKTQISQFLKNAYGLPHLTIKSIIEELKNEEDEFAQQMKIRMEELRAEAIEEQRKAFEDAKKKKKGKKDPVAQFDPDKVVARLPDEDLVKIYKRRLNKSDCLNKGYILDGWPKSSAQCKSLFLDQNSQIIQQIFPNTCFLMEASEDEVKQRIKVIPAQKKQGTHWNEEDTVRRFQAYTKINQQGSSKSFFQGKVDTHAVKIAYEDTQQFISFIERNGPLGFKKKVKEVEKVDEENKEKQDQKQAIQQPGEQKKEDDSDEEEPEPEDQEEPEPEQAEGEFDLQKLTAHQKQILNEKSRPIRQYLIDNVIPQITQGLLQICKDTPRDPIEFLIKFLQNKQRLKGLKK